MREHSKARVDEGCRADGIVVSRRVAMGSSGLAILGALSGAALGRQRPGQGTPAEMRERMEEMRAFGERLRNATTEEERMKIMAERQEAEQNRAIERLKRELGIGDEEWIVIKPRVKAVYDLVHPIRPSGRRDQRVLSPVEEKRSELRQIASSGEATPEQIRAAMTAFRNAREKAKQELTKARQALRQILTVQQEAILVVNDLLD